MVWKNAEINLSAFDLSTPVSRLGWMAVGWIHGGFIEELICRGFLLTRPETLFGKRPWSTVVAVFLLVVFFGLGHAYQGIVGMISTGLSSLVFWAAYFLSKRELGVSLFAHGLWDTIGWLLIFSGS